MSSKPTLPRRILNSKLARASYNEELDWLRPSDLSLREWPRPVVLVNGCFDLLHPGHMRLFFAARQKAGMRGTVICAMDSDRRIIQTKGPSRPILTFPERAAYLNYMPINALVEFDSSEEFDQIISALQPDLRVQGYDHLTHQSSYPHIQKLFVRKGAFHTSTLISRILSKTNDNSLVV